MKSTSSLDPYEDPHYRADIDGLRAFAVSSAVLFHAFPAALPGGFLGVDIFFVISGYLISGIIIRKLFVHQFSLVQFYVKRVRRLFPSLILVLAASLCFGWFALLSTEYSSLGKHVLASVFFFQNFSLLREAGYFDTASEVKPLLHLWSLSIEEQFYIAYPAILVLLWRSRMRLVLSIWILLIFSLCSQVLAVESELKSAFFLPYCRAWQLLIGALVAIVSMWHEWHGNPYDKSLRCMTSAQRHITSSIGLILICFGVCWIKSNSYYSALRQLGTVTGAGLLILAGPAGIMNRAILAKKPLVFIGLISYPLYLWHWPLLSFAHIIESSQPIWIVRALLVGASFILAYATYRLWEVPIRHGRCARLQTGLLVGCLVLLGCAGYSIHLGDGIPSRDKFIRPTSIKGAMGTDLFFKYLHEKYYRCTPEHLAQKADSYQGLTRCLQSLEGAPVEIAIVGDSHAEHLFPGFAAALPTKNVVYYNKGAPPIDHQPDFKPIYEHIRQEKSIKTVVIAMWWGRMPHDTSGNFFLSTVQSLLESGKEVWIMSDSPSTPFQPNGCAGTRRFSSGSDCRVDRKRVEGEMKFLNKEILALLRKEPRVRYLDIVRYFCSEHWCDVTNGDLLLYRDDSHLTVDGSVFVISSLLRDTPNFTRSSN